MKTTKEQRKDWRCNLTNCNMMACKLIDDIDEYRAVLEKIVTDHNYTNPEEMVRWAKSALEEPQ